MSPTLLRPRRRAAVPPTPVEGSAPSAPTGISLTTAPLVPTALTLTTAPSPPLAPSLATTPDSPTGVTVETGLVAPTNVGLLAAPKNLTVTEVFAPDSPTGLDLTAAPASPTGVQLSAVPSEPTSVTVASAPSSPTGVGLLGAPTNVSATESAATDPYFSDVSLLLQDSLTDESPQGQTLAVSGDAAISTAQVKVGTHSLAFDGNGDWVTASADTSLVFGTGPFTVEFWMYWDGVITGTPYMGVMGVHNASGTGRYAIFMSSAGIGHYIQSAFPAMTAIPANQWVHIASTRDSSGVCRFFVDGVLATSVTDAGDLTAPQGFRVGNDFANARPPFSGYIDALRITKGVARYTSNFTPPTSAFPN